VYGMSFIDTMNIVWDEEKSKKLKRERGISPEEVATLILEKGYLDILEHPKRPGQRLFVVPIEEYIHVVPFVMDADGNIVPKAAFPSRKFHKSYGGKRP
jgi:uncharacterized DUF497 family protein